MVIKESVKDLIINVFLYTKNLIRSFSGKREKSNSNITSKMELIFEDNFQSFNKDFWRIGQPWGEFHPEGLYQYYGKDSVFIKDDCLILNQIYSPKQLSTWYDSLKVYDIPYSIGLVTSFRSFEYGFYEFEVETNHCDLYFWGIKGRGDRLLSILVVLSLVLQCLGFRMEPYWDLL